MKTYAERMANKDHPELSPSVPLNFEKIKMIRQTVLPATGPLSFLVELSATFTYCRGVLNTGFVRKYRRKNRGSVNTRSYRPIRVDPCAWAGCVEALTDQFPFLETYGHLETVEEDMTKTDEMIDNHPILGFLKKNGMITIKRTPCGCDYTILCKEYMKANPASKIHYQTLSEMYPNINPITTNGFCFLSRYIASSLVPGNVNNHWSRNYKKFGLEFTFTDAYYDLYLNTCYNDNFVLGSQLGAIVCLDGINPVINYTYLAERWGWSRAKVSRFFKQWSSLITVYSLGSNRGSVIYLNHFMGDQFFEDAGNPMFADTLPTAEQVMAAFVNIPNALSSSDALAASSPISRIPARERMREIVISLLARVGLTRDNFFLQTERLVSCFLANFPRFTPVSCRRNHCGPPVVLYETPPMRLVEPFSV